MSGSEQPADIDKRGSDVFLSYSRDDQPRARKILELLEEAGISVWWDAMLEGGARFHEVTEANLENAAAVVVLWSEVSTKSHWVHDEATRGRDRGCLIPVSIDGTLPPLGFRQFQWIDVSNSDWTAGDPQIQKLIHAIAAKRDGEISEPALFAQTVSPPAKQADTIQTAPIISRRTAIIGGGVGALALSVAGIGAWSAGVFSGGGSSRRLAVMPFDVLGDPGDQVYFAEGFAGEIRSLLARNPLLHVAAKTSSSAFTGVSATAGEICEKLGVDFLLNGDVRIENGRLIGSSQLEDGRSDRVVRPFKIDAPFDNVLTLQQKIAAEIIQELAGSQGRMLSGKEIGGTANLAAYDAFLRGQEMYDSSTDEATDRAALALFDEAIRLDPEYAAATAMRGRTLGLIGNLYTGPANREQVYGGAIKAAERAIAIAPEFPNGHQVLGWIQVSGKLDMQAARAPYEKAYALGAGDAEILSRYAVFRGRIGDADGARKAIEAAMSLDPLNARVFRFAGYIEYYSGNYAEAIERLDQAIELQNPLSSYHYHVGLSQLALGDLDAAKTSFEADEFFVWNKTGLAIVEHKLGNIETAQAHFAELQDKQGDKSNYQYMQIQAQWGDQDAALEAMEAAWVARDSGLLQIYKDPLVDSLREQPRFDQLVRRMGFE
ncbi:TIR domain-containing protein [Erythrobacter insulae]|uniref:TIR domain-containing protein n=1 Tax=Erythrobacter insulae TaxID=2584124 RepID=A0A547PD17_9SPHN|nr:TIR domain-containing protein [Erythrobacter insulae]TRD11934.1 TIR domain-containing protein [Erythrobacter insulae]